MLPIAPARLPGSVTPAGPRGPVGPATPAAPWSRAASTARKKARSLAWSLRPGSASRRLEASISSGAWVRITAATLSGPMPPASHRGRTPSAAARRASRSSATRWPVPPRAAGE